MHYARTVECKCLLFVVKCMQLLAHWRYVLHNQLLSLPVTAEAQGDQDVDWVARNSVSHGTKNPYRPGFRIESRK